MSNHDPRSRQLRRVMGRVNFDGIGDPFAEISIFSGAETIDEIEQRLREQVAQEVGAIKSVIGEFDGLDVIELMRQREIPIAPVLALEQGFDGSAAAMELIALLVVARGQRRPASTPREDTRPNAAIDELHERAMRLLRLGLYRAKAIEFMRGRAPLDLLSAEYQSYMVGVRTLQYESVQAAHEQALFDGPEIDEMLRAHLGFTYREFTTVRSAVHDYYSDQLTSARDATADILHRAEAEVREPNPSETLVLRRFFIEVFLHPGDRATFTAADIAGHQGLDEGLVERVLDAFSSDFDFSRDATQLVSEFLHGRSLFASKGLVRADGRHVIVGGPLVDAAFRATAEGVLRPTEAWKRYDRIRCETSESLAVRALERALRSPVLARNLEYYAPRPSEAVETLGPDCVEPTRLGILVESDALFVVDDVAMCLEVKARAIAEQAKRGDLARLEREISNILGDGARQARRLESLIMENNGIWDSNRDWIDLGHVRETRTIVVGLDSFGPLGIALGELASGDLVGEGRLPWIASLHDLEIISRVVDRPAEFLLYLRRRTDTGIAKHYRGSDELDLFMLFMGGGLYVDDDPDEVHRLHPHTPPPTKTARAQHERAAFSTLVATHTDPLDAWMYWVEGTSPDAIDKPVFNVEPEAADLVDSLARGEKPGWLRIGADLLGLAGHAQRKLIANLRRIVNETRTDSLSHSLVQGFASASGFMTFFAWTIRANTDPAVEFEALQMYMLAKKHQVRSDRSLGVLLDRRGRIQGTIYMNHPAGDDQELDEMEATIGLQRTWEKPRRPPPTSKKKRRPRSKRW
jgi:hypothetical protein